MTATRTGIGTLAVGNLRARWLRLGLGLSLILLIALTAVLSPSFLSVNNLLNVVRQASVVGVAAVGVTFVVLLRGVDISVAGVITMVATAASGIMNGSDENIALAVLVALALGVGVGVFNGVLAARNVHPFILTLGVGVVLLGATQLYTGGTGLGNLAPSFRSALNLRIGAVPVLTVLFVGVAAIGILIHRRTSFGHRVTLSGANPSAARLSGISVDRHVIIAYALSGATAALAGLFLLARSGPPSNFTGMGLEFQTLAAVILGGTSFAGGRGSVEGSIAGALMLALAFNLVTIVGLPFSAQQIVQGAIIVVVAAVYSLTRVNTRNE